MVASSLRTTNKIDKELQKYGCQDINESGPSSCERYKPYIEQPRTQIRRANRSRLMPHQQPLSTAHVLVVHAATTQSNTTGCYSQKKGGWEWNKNGISTALWPSVESEKTLRNHIKKSKSRMTKVYHALAAWNAHDDDNLLVLWLVNYPTMIIYLHNACSSLQWRSTTCTTPSGVWDDYNLADDACLSLQWRYLTRVNSVKAQSYGKLATCTKETSGN